MSDFPDIPGFTCNAVLGRGGMAVVYSATEHSLGRRVAIKVVSAGDSDGAQHLRRLEQEARGLANLQHPHIVELYNFGHTRSGALWYAMPQLDGGDLASRARPLDEAFLRAMLDALLGALAQAHASGIVHRDIKPGNILFDRYDRPMLADFGAAFVRGAQRITDGDMAIGSTAYMSPEQGRGREVDARSDLYSLAVLAFEYLSGELPFFGEDDLATAIAKEEHPVPRLRAPLAHWQAFFDRALAVRVDARYANAEAMRIALPMPMPMPAHAPARRTRMNAGVLVAAAAVLTLVGTVMFWPRDASDAARDAPVVAPAPVAPEPRRALAEIVAPPTPTPASEDRASPVVAVGSVEVMRAPVDKPSYRRFLDTTSRPAFECPGAPGAAQGCIGPVEGERYAAWLSQQTGKRWRLPSRAELTGAVPQLTTLAAHAWTSTCDERRVVRQQNVARRAWSGVRRAFGRDALRSRTTIECAGNFAVALDGRGGDVRVLDRAGPDTVLVLAREP